MRALRADVEPARVQILSASPCPPCLRRVIWTREGQLNRGDTESTEKKQRIRVWLVRVTRRRSGPRITLMRASGAPEDHERRMEDSRARLCSRGLSTRGRCATVEQCLTVPCPSAWPHARLG